MAKKKIVITLSREFPKTLPMAGQPTGFREKLHNTVTRHLQGWCKLHTIRKNYDLWKHNADKSQSGEFYLSVRQWSARPYNSPQVEIEQLHHPFHVQRIRMCYHCHDDSICAWVDGKLYMGDNEVRTIAYNDGLLLDQFKDWFFADVRYRADDEFNGVVIHFTDFAY